MKKLFAMLLVLTTLPTRPMETKEICILGTVAIGTLGVAACFCNHVYKQFNPTVEDLQQKVKDRKEKEEYRAKHPYQSGMAKLIEHEKNTHKWEEACVETGKILPQEPFFQNQQ